MTTRSEPFEPVESSRLKSAVRQTEVCATSVRWARSAGLKALSLPTSFGLFVEDFYSFTHPHQFTPPAPDGLPARHSVVFAGKESSQFCHGDQNGPIGPAFFWGLLLRSENLQGVGPEALSLHRFIRPVAGQPLRIHQPHRPPPIRPKDSRSETLAPTGFLRFQPRF